VNLGKDPRTSGRNPVNLVGEPFANLVNEPRERREGTTLANLVNEP
jgi:hypothetical protein